MSARLLTRRVDGAAVPWHPALHALAVVRAVAPQARELPARLVATEAEVAREGAAVAVLGIDPAQPFVVVVAGDPRSIKTWPAEQAAREAAASGLPAFALAGPQEPATVPLPRGLPLLHHGRGELRRLVALGVLLARCGGRAFGPDSGPTHLLAACGAAVTAMFGPQDPARTAPLGARVLLHALAPPCVPCRRRVCHHPEGPVCMRFHSGTAKVWQPS